MHIVLFVITPFLMLVSKEELFGVWESSLAYVKSGPQAFEIFLNCTFYVSYPFESGPLVSLLLRITAVQTVIIVIPEGFSKSVINYHGNFHHIKHLILSKMELCVIMCKGSGKNLWPPLNRKNGTR